MSSDDRKPWIAKLPSTTTARDQITHRYRIAGRTGDASAASSRALATAASSFATPAMASDRMRAQMVARVAERGVNDRRVLDALANVPRHVFVDGALASRAYENSSLPIGHGQTISQPYIVARMLELMRNGRDLDRVLEIGTGCGYQAAVLARIAGLVVSIERIKALHEFARDKLQPMRISNLRLHFGDGHAGAPAHAPYDGIVLAAAGDAVPPALLGQLAIRGRLVAPVARANRGQRLVLIERVAEERWETREFDDVNFVPLRSGTT